MNLMRNISGISGSKFVLLLLLSVLLLYVFYNNMKKNHIMLIKEIKVILNVL